MTKNVKSIFLVATLLFLLVGVSAISASELSDDNTIIQDTTDTVAPEITTSDKIVDTPTKNIKKEEQITDLYVSDTTGSDDNSGTQTSPYKTIQKALDSTTADSTFNIYIAEGTYKGLGNTNLTVNGNNTVNIIGITNKTIIDGEAKYDIDITQYHWDSSDIWSFYVNDSGNWVMKITSGTGNVKISNLTIMNAYSPGGDRIYLYPNANIDNYGQLTVDNVFFLNNHGGVGSAIRNNKDATLTVNNSLFIGNRKSSSTGNDGIIYNNGTATIINSIFDKNYARWGTVLNDKKIKLINTTISNNIGYDGQSTYSYGPGFAYNTGQADFYNPGYFYRDRATIVF